MWVCEVKFGRVCGGGSVNQIKQISQNCIIFLKASINDCPEDIASVMGCHYSCVTWGAVTRPGITWTSCYCLEPYNWKNIAHFPVTTWQLINCFCSTVFLAPGNVRVSLKKTFLAGIVLLSDITYHFSGKYVRYTYTMFRPNWKLITW